MRMPAQHPRRLPRVQATLPTARSRCIAPPTAPATCISTPRTPVSRIPMASTLKVLPVTSGSNRLQTQLVYGKATCNHRWFFHGIVIAVIRMETERLLSFFKEFLRDFRELLANLAGQPVMDAPGLYARDVRDNYR